MQHGHEKLTNNFEGEVREIYQGKFEFGTYQCDGKLFRDVAVTKGRFEAEVLVASQKL